MMMVGSRYRYVAVLLPVGVALSYLLVSSYQASQSEDFTVPFQQESNVLKLEHLTSRCRHLIGLNYLKKFQNISHTRNTTKITQLIFLKVGKAGSSTVTALLYKFGLNHNLTFALPKRAYYYNEPNQVMPYRNKTKFDILHEHSWFNKTFYESIMPKNVVKIAIVREPLERMISRVYYFKDTDKRLIDLPSKNLINTVINNANILEPNGMAALFGFPKSILPNETKRIMQYLNYLNHEFQLVLILKKLHESLIMMKRMFNWNLNDIIYMHMKSNPHETVNISVDEKLLFRKREFLDYHIYEYFLAQFERLVCLMNDDFMEEVDHFKDVINIFSLFCASKRETVQIEKSKWNSAFQIEKAHCRYPHAEQLRQYRQKHTLNATR